MQKITTFLMFEGNAEEAINFYMSLFKNSRIVKMNRYGAGEEGVEGTIKNAVFSLNGQDFMAIDRYRKHNFTFTPSMSLFVNCDKEEEINDLFNKLSKNGMVLMKLDKYPFSHKFGWVADKFGVSWQLNLTKN